MQSLEAMQGVVQQEMQSLKAERGTFKDLVHDAKWAASQAAGPDQASVSICPAAELLRLPTYLFQIHINAIDALLWHHYPAFAAPGHQRMYHNNLAEVRLDASRLAVLCCAVLCCAVLCCAVLCCAVLCCIVPVHNAATKIL